MKNKFKKIRFEDLKLTPAEVKIMVDGAQEFLAPTFNPDEEDITVSGNRVPPTPEPVVTPRKINHS